MLDILFLKLKIFSNQKRNLLYSTVFKLSLSECIMPSPFFELRTMHLNESGVRALRLLEIFHFLSAPPANYTKGAKCKEESSLRERMEIGSCLVKARGENYKRGALRGPRIIKKSLLVAHKPKRTKAALANGFRDI